MKRHLVLAAGLLMTTAAVQAADTQRQAPGYYRMALGKLTVTAVSDGTVTIPLDQLLVPIDKETLQRRMAEDAMTPQAETSLNTFVIDDGKQRVLVDTGAGQLFGNNGGHLLENLRAAGYPADSINAVLLTHVHGDHSGGVSQQGKPTFPNADVYVDKRDPDFWLNDANQSKVEEGQRHTFKESADALNPLIAAGKLKTFSAPARLPLGIQAQAAYGHTPGSVTYRIESEGQTLVLWGDIIHAKAVQMPEPQVAIHFDVDRRQAIATRERILAQAAKEGFWVAAAHISFPGLGHVQRQGNGYRWVPANYSTQLAK
ncbi:MBL fold metallo-hydrolase [Serratia sp. MYb239]|uniref:MBL fold metallo-hydrolase n=1 Tax=Serratia sp. MYb239 TaxID=2033438 RepID=UPI000CF7371A|nr:MBL fold metallo-hydrolase [Serratia sp. MYb239]AVJ17710.1 MBL fold metallo-hydrolase [Serratia sp. MYb239]QPT11340.1 MBL fold metallo-hydrolase [Serratia rubidaea]